MFRHFRNDLNPQDYDIDLLNDTFKMVLRVTPATFAFWEHPSTVPPGFCGCGGRDPQQVSKTYYLHSRLDVSLDKASGVVYIRDLRAADFVIMFTTDNPYLVEAAFRGLIESTRFEKDCVLDVCCPSSHLFSSSLFLPSC